MNIMAGLGVAVREFPLTTGEADYGLYIDGKVAGVIEAKKEGANLTGAKISRLAASRSDAWHTDIEKFVVPPSGGFADSQSATKHLISTLFDSVDADKNRELAASKFSVTPDAVTDTQLDEIEAEQVRAALFPFHNAKLREILLRPEHQVIDKFTRDQLLTSSFDPEAKQRAETLVTSFRQFIEDNKAEIEAISISFNCKTVPDCSNPLSQIEFLVDRSHFHAIAA